MTTRSTSGPSKQKDKNVLSSRVPSSPRSFVFILLMKYIIYTNKNLITYFVFNFYKYEHG
jgi:hypothetical protein